MARMVEAGDVDILRLRVATYNIHGCIGLDGRYDPGRICRVIRGLDAEVVALQEVDGRRGLHEGLPLIDYVERATGLMAIRGETQWNERGGFGNALLTRFPILSAQRIDLSLPGREPRIALDVKLSLPGGPVRVLATHLGRRGAERRKQTTRLIEALGVDPPPLPTLLLGDLNEWLPWSTPLRSLRRRFSMVCHPRSFPSVWPLFALDRIYAHPAPTEWKVSASTANSARLASDHLPVVVELNWSPLAM